MPVRTENIHKSFCFRPQTYNAVTLYVYILGTNAVNICSRVKESITLKLYPSLFFQFVLRPYRQTANRNTALAPMTYQITGLSIQMRTQQIKPLNALQVSELPRNQQLPRPRYVQKHTASFLFLTSTSPVVFCVRFVYNNVYNTYCRHD